MNQADIIKKLKLLSNAEAVKGMARYGIILENTYGVSIPNLRKIAKEVGKDHKLAQDLWNSKIHEARILASMIDEPDMLTSEQMDLWAYDFDSWDVCDQCCNNLFYKTPFAYKKSFERSSDEREFVKRAGFVMMSVITIKNSGIH